jgi:hypothetical protein
MSTNSISMWDQAIEDARKIMGALHGSKQRMSRLRGAIAVCEEKKRLGERWPVAKSINPLAVSETRLLDRTIVT